MEGAGKGGGSLDDANDLPGRSVICTPVSSMKGEGGGPLEDELEFLAAEVHGVMREESGHLLLL